MGSIIKAVMASGFVLAAVFLLAIGKSEPANAQGGIVCDYGPKQYRDCCKQSYKKHPNLSASKRADDIDACMNEKPKSKK